MQAPIAPIAPIGRLERAFVAANRWLLIVLLAVMACIVFTNVVLRYLT
ncbi:MAG: TRAP transporter small permease, partial [Burkholderiaceae bacterium]